MKSVVTMCLAVALLLQGGPVRACMCADAAYYLEKVELLFEGVVVESRLVRVWSADGWTEELPTEMRIHEASGLHEVCYAEHVLEVTSAYKGRSPDTITVRNFWNSCRAEGFALGQRMLVGVVRGKDGHWETGDCLLTGALGHGERIPKRYLGSSPDSEVRRRLAALIDEADRTYFSRRQQRILQQLDIQDPVEVHGAIDGRE